MEEGKKDMQTMMIIIEDKNVLAGGKETISHQDSWANNTIGIKNTDPTTLTMMKRLLIEESPVKEKENTGDKKVWEDKFKIGLMGTKRERNGADKSQNTEIESQLKKNFLNQKRSHLICPISIDFSIFYHKFGNL